MSSFWRCQRSPVVPPQSLRLLGRDGSKDTLGHQLLRTLDDSSAGLSLECSKPYCQSKLILITKLTRSSSPVNYGVFRRLRGWEGAPLRPDERRSAC